MIKSDRLDEISLKNHDFTIMPFNKNLFLELQQRKYISEPNADLNSHFAKPNVQQNLSSECSEDPSRKPHCSTKRQVNPYNIF